MTTNIVKEMNDTEIVFADGTTKTFSNFNELKNYAIENYLDVDDNTVSSPYTVALNRINCNRESLKYNESDDPEWSIRNDFEVYVDDLKDFYSAEYCSKKYIWVFDSFDKLIVKIKKGSTQMTKYDNLRDMLKSLDETGSYNNEVPEYYNILQLEQALRYNVCDWSFGWVRCFRSKK